MEHDSYVVLPDEIEGEAGHDTGMIMHFPEIFQLRKYGCRWNLKEVGRYAFYRCRNLRKLVLGNQTAGYGRWCTYGLPSGRSRDISSVTGKKSCLKSIVEEMRYQIRVSVYIVHAPEGRVQMKCEKLTLFRSIMKRRWRTPLQEYWKRIITGQADIIVSVFMTVNWTIEKYDEMFYHTVAEDTEETAVELALNRLRFPAGTCQIRTDKVMKTYLKKHMTAVAKWIW